MKIRVLQGRTVHQRRQVIVEVPADILPYEVVECLTDEGLLDQATEPFEVEHAYETILDWEVAP
jgi:hypothetical protein